MKYESIKVGETYYEVSKGKMGNTTVTTVRVHPIHVTAKDDETRRVKTSMGRLYSELVYRRWRKTKPVLITNFFGAQRLARRDEIKAMKERGEIK